MKLRIDLWSQKLLILAAVLFTNFAIAQQTVSGTVTDAQTGETLIGVNILVVGTSTGTITDFDGYYSVTLSEGMNELQFSYTGYQSQTIAVNGQTTINVELAAGEVLDEVVVIGYGTVKREDATGAIQTVSTKDFQKGAITSAQDLIAGKVAGVQITPSSAPGEAAAIRIRGGSSLSASNDPLIVVDGVPIETGAVSGARNALSLVNPNDIETFTVLKDASATAIYGSRASNGVILITTKKGRLGKKLSVNYNGNVAFSNPIQTVEVLSANEYRALIEKQFPANHPARTLLGSADTDWQDQIYQTGVMTDHNLSLSGGAFDVLPYRLAVGYTNQTGILKRDEFTRTTASLNLSPSFINNTLQFNLNTKAMWNNNFFANRGAIGSAAYFDPTQPVFDEGNPYGGYFTWTNPNGTPNTLAPDNPLALLNQRDDQSDVQRYIINGSVDYRFGFLPELRANLNLGYDISKGEGTINVPENAAFSYNEAIGGGEDNTYSQERRNELLEFYLNYVKDLGNTRLDVMGGYSWQHFYQESSFRNSNIRGTDITEGEDSGELYLLSLFGRLNYSIMDRYLFTFTLRRDGTSRFSPDNRWGLFPAAAFAWKILDNASVGPLNNLKLRLGYGVTGQQDVGGYYLYLPSYTASFDNARYQLGNQFYTTLRPEGYDANIKWEETTTYNVGLDFGFLDGRLNGAIEYYYRQTTDLLNYIPVPAGTNLTNFINTNVGDLENRGVELSLNAIPVETDKLMWEIGFNVTMNQNEITRLTATDDPNYPGVATGGISGGVGNTIQIHSVGFPASSFLVYEQVYDAAGIPIEGLFVDRNGDGQVTPDDRYRFENPAPDAFFGLTSNFSYGNFDFSFAARASVGNYMYNNRLSDGSDYNRLYQSTNYLGNILSRYTEVDFTTPRYFSDHFIEDASFLKVDHFTVGYNFSEVIKNINTLRVYATLQNPIIITKYQGIDPEVFGGIDGSIYPRSRTFLIGLNANF